MPIGLLILAVIFGRILKPKAVTYEEAVAAEAAVGAVVAPPPEVVVLPPPEEIIVTPPPEVVVLPPPEEIIVTPPPEIVTPPVVVVPDWFRTLYPSLTEEQLSTQYANWSQYPEVIQAAYQRYLEQQRAVTEAAWATLPYGWYVINPYTKVVLGGPYDNYPIAVSAASQLAASTGQPTSLISHEVPAD